MPSIHYPPDTHKRLIRRRRKSGRDRYDETWDGVYVMSPEADLDHQELSTSLASALIQATESQPRHRIYSGANVSDRSKGWTENYRVPDVAVFSPGNPAEKRKAYWLGGPDFAVEVVSEGDRSREKFEFYAKVAVRELLLVDRDPWRLELYRNHGEELVLAGTFILGDVQSLKSIVLPVSFRLIDDEERPMIVVTQTVDGRTWTC